MRNPQATTPIATDPDLDVRRQLDLFDATALVVGIILGAGIFVTPALVARTSATPMTPVLLWVFGGFVALCGGLCYAECGVRLPRDGGFYRFYHAAFGEPVAFVGGWAGLLVTYPASLAGVSLVFAQYLAQLLPPVATWTPHIGALVLCAAGVINIIGVRAGAWTQRVLTVLKVAALAMLCGAALLASPPSATAALPVATTTAHAGPAGWSLMSAALTAIVAIMWTYDGWTDVTMVAGEIKNPARNLGRSVLLGIGVLVLLYVAVQWSIYRLLPPDRIATSEHIFAAAIEAAFGTGYGKVVALLVVVSTLGAVNGVVLAATRLSFAMARDGVFPRWFGRLHPRFATPARATIVLVVPAVIYVFTGTFVELLSLFAFAVWIFYGLTAIALLVLRHRDGGLAPDWRAPGGIVPPIVVLLAAIGMTTGLLLQDPRRSLTGLVLLVLGFPAYALWRRLGRRLGAAVR